LLEPLAVPLRIASAEARHARGPCSPAVRMAEKLFKVVQLDDGSITVDAPASEFPEKGYFTLYDKSASARGECEPMRRQRRDTARVSGRQERPCDPPGVAMMPGALPGGRHVTTSRTNARAPWSRPACSAAAVPAREQPRCTQTSPAACCVQAIGRFSVRSPYALRARLLLLGGRCQGTLVPQVHREASLHQGALFGAHWIRARRFLNFV
jgi:hypothetical protein